MRDLGGTRLDRSADLGQWKAALRAYAGMQIQSIGAIDDLLAAGCQNRRLAGLHDRIDADLADTAAMMPDDPDPLTADALTEEEVDRVRSQAGRLHDAVDTLARGPVPETLDHGDLHAGNIVETGSTMRIFDWSDACIGHPFFSLLTFLDFHAPPGGAGGRQALETAYLEPWTSFAPMPALRDALAAATPLAVMHQVSSYRHILRTVEPALRWEWASVVPYFLRMLLRGGR
jgi:Ser/Thr protein kinase RdoA (MazF antagonist)